MIKFRWRFGGNLVILFVHDCAHNTSKLKFIQARPSRVKHEKNAKCKKIYCDCWVSLEVEWVIILRTFPLSLHCIATQKLRDFHIYIFLRKSSFSRSLTLPPGTSTTFRIKSDFIVSNYQRSQFCQSSQVTFLCRWECECEGKRVQR